MYMKPLHIVLEGPDASGKKTQSTLLVERLRAEGMAAERLSFPQYEEPFGHLITQYLEGNSPSTDPAYASILYAADRASAAPKIRELLAAGTWVICDRYVESNQAHQVANLPENYRLTPDAFIKWIAETEYNVLKIPRADHTILLNVPFELAVQKAAERKAAEQRTNVDIHEENTNHMKRAWELYQSLAKTGNWPVIDCAPMGVLLPREEIAEMVWGVVTQISAKG
jgi:dTMP kinase